MLRIFRDRHDAGAQLARALHGYTDAADVVVLAHTATSVPVAYEIATRLALPLDLLATELRLDIRDKVLLLVDDGARARAMPPTIERLRSSGGRAVIAATAVASPQVHALLSAAADRTVCLLTPQHIYSIEAWYADLTEPTSDDVHELLVAAAQNLLGLRRGKFLIRDVDT